MFLPAFFSICCLFAFVLELSRLHSRTAGKVFTELCVLGVGLASLAFFLTERLFESARTPLSTPKDALFVLVGVLTAISLGLISTHRQKNFGLFLLPMILVLLGIAQFFASSTPFAVAPASRAWGLVHGLSMLLAAVSIFVGFLTGVMYLRQAWNLKHPGPASSRRSRFSLPSLEWLHIANRHSMKLAATMLALGVLSGIVLDVRKAETVNLLANWMILGTGLLLVWFVFSLLLGFFWKRANAGPQIAYRTILNFLALCTLFGLVIFSQHRLTNSEPLAGATKDEPLAGATCGPNGEPLAGATCGPNGESLAGATCGPNGESLAGATCGPNGEPLAGATCGPANELENVQKGPQAAPANELPADAGPQAAPANELPADAGPQAAPANKGPQAAPANRGPQAAPANKGPQAAPANKGPQAAPANKGPQAASANKGPQAAPANKGPQAAPANETEVNP